MTTINVPRQQWAEGEIEAGTLLDAIDLLEHEKELMCQSRGVAAYERDKAREERDAALAELAALKGGREVACYQFQTREGTWRQFDNERHYQDTLKAGGWPIRALYTAPPAQASAWVPEGWKLVPVEPTGAMMLNESGCQHHAWDDNGCAARRVRFGVWAKMLSAAPTPGASDGSEEA